MIEKALRWIMGDPSDMGNDSSDDGEIVVSEIGEVFAIFISMVMTVVHVVFALDFPDPKTCPKCPFMRVPGVKNHTIDYYKCEAQRDFLETMWSPVITAYWSLMSAILAGCSMVVGQIISPVVMRLIKHTFVAAMASLLWYITEFQYHFDSVSKLSAYVKSVFTVYMSVLPLVVIVGVCPSGPSRRLVKCFIFCIGSALMFHLGLSGYNLFCGRATRPLSAFLALYFFFVSKMAVSQDVPSHVGLFMCLLVMPPVCPMVVLLLCWCFDVFWTDLSDLVVAPREQLPAGANSHNRPRFHNGYRLPPTISFGQFSF